MRYATLGGGKRLRPFLVVESAALFGVARGGALLAGCALELLHCYSLAHDDLPAMDNDDLRRGRPTLHKAFDEATAILAGDALLTLAFDIMARDEVHADAKIRIELVRDLARTSGIGGMAGGQMLDLSAEGRFAPKRTLTENEIVTLQAMKTGALIRFACRAGAVLGAGRRTSARRYRALRRRDRPGVSDRRRSARCRRRQQTARQGRRQGRHRRQGDPGRRPRRRWCAQPARRLDRLRPTPRWRGSGPKPIHCARSRVSLFNGETRIMASKKPIARRPLPVRFVQLHNKLLIAAAIGIIVSLVLPEAFKAPARILIGWDAALVIYLALAYAMMRRAEIDHIRKRAAEEDEGAGFILLLSIASTAASFVAIAFALGGIKSGQASVIPGGVAAHVVLAITTILLSWAFVHTIFTFHYAHEFYSDRRDGEIGGLKFPHDDKPDYRDFLYFSLVIGMTSQTSDVNICSKVMRRMAALHGVLAFFFNLTVIALTINMVSNLI